MEEKIFDSGGVKISYVKKGRGRAVILLHGNGESHMAFNVLIEMLSADYTVFIPDTRGHGKSGAVKRLNYADMADDIAGLIAFEKMEKPILFGFSDGGIVGLLLAIKHPEILGRLLVAGINLTPKGIRAGDRFLMRLAFLFSRSDKLRLMLTQPNITAEQLQNITVPTVIFYAEKDMVKKADSQTVADSVKDGKIVFVPKETHGSYIKDNKKLYKYLTENM